MLLSRRVSLVGVAEAWRDMSLTIRGQLGEQYIKSLPFAALCRQMTPSALYHGISDECMISAPLSSLEKITPQHSECLMHASSRGLNEDCGKTGFVSSAAITKMRGPTPDFLECFQTGRMIYPRASLC